VEQKTEQPIFKKILVIDDTETDRYIADFAIKRYKLANEVVLKESGKKALEYLTLLQDKPGELPDIIFLDIRMPEMNGFQFLEAYSKLPETVKIKSVIMMLSTSLNTEDHKNALENPYVNRFLNKPLNKENIEILKHDFVEGKFIN
jgi:CheY-like chemotaxis protein